ncbi:MAG: CopD family protein [Sporichthya sp.]|nr:CopD family protein [Sporichthya sp.]
MGLGVNVTTVPVIAARSLSQRCPSRGRAPPDGRATGTRPDALGLAALVLGQGSLWRGASSLSLQELFDGRAGRAALTEIVAFAVAGGLAAARRERWAGIPLMAVVLAEGLRAHAATAAPGWGALLTAVHVLAASIWVGALTFVVIVMVRWRRLGWSTHARAVLGAYARLALWLFAGVVVSGTLSALLLVPWSAWTTTAYGRVLLVKVALVGVVTVLALVARRHLSARSAPATQRSPRVRILGAETGVLALVVSLTAFLVSLPTPRALGGSALPIPPPPVGLSVPLGARAGAIGVSATASEGQLVVRLSAPRLGNRAVDTADRNHYDLSGTLTTDAGAEQPLAWLSCGPGCFVTAIRWPDGVNTVRLRARAEGWPGGTVQLTLPWPARPGGDELRAVVAAMRKLGSIVIEERVTSDTSAGARPGDAATRNRRGVLGERTLRIGGRVPGRHRGQDNRRRHHPACRLSRGAGPGRTGARRRAPHPAGNPDRAVSPDHAHIRLSPRRQAVAQPSEPQAVRSSVGAEQ